MLQDAGVVRHRWTFLLARALKRGRMLQAGEYRFDRNRRRRSRSSTASRAATSSIYELVVPEGKNMFDIAAAADSFGLFPAAQFLQAARNPAMIRDLDPQAPTLEGYLFPNTYKARPPHHAGAAVPDHDRPSSAKSGAALNAEAGVHETVTLASLVEKEGKLRRGAAADRRGVRATG